MENSVCQLFNFFVIAVVLCECFIVAGIAAVKFELITPIGKFEELYLYTYYIDTWFNIPCYKAVIYIFVMGSGY